MRQFRLLNSLGASFDLMRKDAFFHLPKGLGTDQNLTYMRVGSRYILLENFENQKPVTGEMVFQSYTTYTEFAQFISYKPLTLVYNPNGTEYRMDCDCKTMQKTEIDYKTGRLICPITFQGRGKWYYSRLALRTEDTNGNKKVYNYSYSYVYSDAANGVIESSNNGFDVAPCIIHIMGNIENPTWTLSVNNTTIASGSCTAQIPDGHKLVIDSREENLRVAEYTTQNVFVQDLYSSCDYTKETFLYLPVGGFKLLIQGDTEDGVNAYMEIIEQYDTV